MHSGITLAEIEREPMRIATTAILPSGERVVFRPLHKEDAPLLGCYFLGLSAETKRRYGPHPFDQEMAKRLCATLNLSAMVRMLAVTGEGDARQVIGYFILVWGIGDGDRRRYAERGLTLEPTADCTLAPSVADAYQNQGLGSLLMAHCLEVAQRLGRRKMVLMAGVQATNERAIHFYRKHGFEKVGEFEKPDGFFHYDMWRTL